MGTAACSERLVSLMNSCFLESWMDTPHNTDHKGLVLRGQGKVLEVVSMELAAQTAHLFCCTPFCVSLPFRAACYIMPGVLGRVYSVRRSGEWCSVESRSTEDMPMLFLHWEAYGGFFLYQKVLASPAISSRTTPTPTCYAMMTTAHSLAVP